MRLWPEEELILLCLHADRNAAQGQRLLEILGRADLDWGRLWSSAERYQVQPLVAQVLMAGPFAEFLSDTALEGAKNARLQTMVCNLALHTELQRIAGAFRPRGITAVPLKGTSLTQRLYGSLDSRLTSDIDIFVMESELDQACLALHDLGYRPPLGSQHDTFEMAFLRESGPRISLVDLHWGLTNPRFVTVDYQELWRRILSGGCDEAGLFALPTDETLLFLALHMPKHSLGVPRLVVDIDRLVRTERATLDWDHTLALAERWNITWQLHVALGRARLLVDTPIPDEAAERLAPPPWRSALIGLLSSQRAILRPTASDHLRNNQSWLAYCAMLSPLSRSLDAYMVRLFAPLPQGQPAFSRSALRAAVRITRGLAWTGVILANALGQWLPEVMQSWASRWRGARPVERVAPALASEL